MKNICPICDRVLGIAYHGKKIRKKFCSRKCESFFKEHFCVMYRRGEFESYCNNKLFKSTEKLCSKECKEDFFEKGKKVYKEKECSKCFKTKKYPEFRFRGRGWKSPNALYRQAICRDCENQRQKDKRDENPIHRLFLLAKRRAVKDKLDFNLTEDYIESKWPKNNKCPIFDTEFKSGLKNKNVLPTIDKIVPQKGYTKGNIAIISFLANKMKSDVKDMNQFKKLYEFYKNYK
jgi:hypothetical protein